MVARLSAAALALVASLAGCDREDGIKASVTLGSEAAPGGCIAEGLSKTSVAHLVRPAYGGHGWEVPLSLRRSTDDAPVGINYQTHRDDDRTVLVTDARWISAGNLHSPEFDAKLKQVLVETIDAIVRQCRGETNWRASCEYHIDYAGPCPDSTMVQANQ